MSSREALFSFSLTHPLIPTKFSNNHPPILLCYPPTPRTLLLSCSPFSPFSPKAIVNEAIKYATEMETSQKPLQFLQENIKDYNPDTMSEELKNYIWDALKYEMESAKV